MSATGIDLTKRNAAIDILRVFTMLMMIFVNDFWTAKGVPHWMGHAAATEDMLGFSDIIFPAFLFVVGMSVPYAIEGRFSKGFTGLSTAAHILVRSLALIIMGVFTVNTEAGVHPGTGFLTPVYKILMVIAFFMVWNVYPATTTKSTGHLYSALKIIGLLIIFTSSLFFATQKAAFSARDGGEF